MKPKLAVRKAKKKADLNYRISEIFRDIRVGVQVLLAMGGFIAGL